MFTYVIVGVLVCVGNGLVECQTIVDVSTCASFLGNINNCIVEPPVEVNTDFAVQATSFYLMNSSLVCSDGWSEFFPNLLDCVTKATSECLSDESLITLLATAESYKTAFKYFCENRQDFQATCLLNSFGEVNSCLTAKRQNSNMSEVDANSGFSAWKIFICKTGEYTSECIAESEGLDECTSTRTISTQIFSYITPPACSTGEATSLMFVTLTLVFTSFVSMLNNMYH